MNKDLFKRLIKEIVQESILTEDSEISDEFVFLWDGSEYEIKGMFLIGSGKDVDHRPTPGGGFENPSYSFPSGISIDYIESVTKDDKPLTTDSDIIEKIANQFISKRGNLGKTPEEISHNKRSYHYFEQSVIRRYEQGY